MHSQELEDLATAQSWVGHNGTLENVSLGSGPQTPGLERVPSYHDAEVDRQALNRAPFSRPPSHHTYDEGRRTSR